MSEESGRRFGITLTHRQRILVLVAVLVVVLGLGLILGARGSALVDPVGLRTWIAGFGLLAPIVFVALQAGQVLFAPVPGQVLGLVAGYLFGAVLGTVYSVVGATIGSVLAFWLSRRYGRPFVARTVDEETLATFDLTMARRGYLVLFLVFLVPGLPDDLICFVAGLSEMDIWKMTLVSLVGRLPGYFIVAAAGAELAAADFLQAAAIIAVLVLVSLVGYRYRDRIQSLAHVF